LNKEIFVLISADEFQNVGMLKILKKFKLVPRPELVEGPRAVQDLHGHVLILAAIKINLLFCSVKSNIND